MQDLYKQDIYCMNFSSYEIEEYLVRPLREFKEINPLMIMESGVRMPSYQGNEKIRCVHLDGEVGNFSINFFGHQTSIFISDETASLPRTFTFNEEIMFIDDNVKCNIVSSDTYGNIVYEGLLRNKNHKEMLSLFINFITLLAGATSIVVEDSIVSQTGWQYPKCTYTVNLSNTTGVKRNIQFENILFRVNEIEVKG